MSLSNSFKLKKYDNMYIDLFDLKWINIDGNEFAEKSYIRESIDKNYKKLMNKLNIVDDKLLKNIYDQRSFNVITPRFDKEQGFSSWFTIKHSDLYSTQNIYNYNILTYANDLYRITDNLYNIIETKEEEIKLLKERIETLEKDYKQLTINWTTIMNYMKKIDLIENKCNT